MSKKSTLGLVAVVVSAGSATLLLTHRVVTTASIYLNRLPTLSLVDLAIGVGAMVAIGVLVLRLKNLKEEIYTQNKAFIADLEKRDKKINATIENLGTDITDKFNEALKAHMATISGMVKATQESISNLEESFKDLNNLILEKAFGKLDS